MTKSNLGEEQVYGILQVQSIIEGSQSQDPEAETMKEHHLLAHVQGQTWLPSPCLGKATPTVDWAPRINHPSRQSFPDMATGQCHPLG